MPDRRGNLTDIVLANNSFEDTLNSPDMLGATLGRVAGRISNAKIRLGGVTYNLPSVNGCTIHGGPRGFGRLLWKPTLLPDQEGVRFTIRSPDGDQGFPGNLDASVTYKWSDEGRLSIDYKAVSDGDTAVNLANMIHFNLNGHGAGSVLGHMFRVESDTFLPIDERLCPTGEFARAENTPMDFATAKTMGERINARNRQLELADGYDFSYVLRRVGGIRRAARVLGDKSGIIMDVRTDAPCLHLYSGNNLLTMIGKDGARYFRRGAFLIGHTGFPDSVNHPEFPSAVLKKDSLYHYRAEYTFSAGEVI